MDLELYDICWLACTDDPVEGKNQQGLTDLILCHNSVLMEC